MLKASYIVMLYECVCVPAGTHTHLHTHVCACVCVYTCVCLLGGKGKEVCESVCIL